MSAVIDWLLEEDEENPGVRLFALRDLLEYPTGSSQMHAAQHAVMTQGPVPVILASQDPLGFWIEPGSGYYPKYRGTVWSFTYLAQLGADPADPRIQASGDHLLQHARATNGAFSMSGTPSGSIYCLMGNLAAALLDLGFSGDARLEEGLELMARFATGEGVAPTADKRAPLRYLKSGACGPGFCCSANDRLPCAWGAVKVLRALARVPGDRRTPLLQAALETAVQFLFSVDPATAGYPVGYSDKPSRSWFRFGFPVFYVTDVLQTAEALTEAGYAGDPRLAATYDLILSKRDASGRWKLEYAYAGKTLADVEAQGKPSKWVTLRAMRALRAGGIEV